MKDYQKTLSTVALETLDLLRMEGAIRLSDLSAPRQKQVHEELVREGLVRIDHGFLYPTNPPVPPRMGKEWIAIAVDLVTLGAAASALWELVLWLLTVHVDPHLVWAVVLGGIAWVMSVIAPHVRPVQPAD